MANIGRILTLDISLVATGWAAVLPGDAPEPLVTFGCIITKPDRRERLKGADDINRVSSMVRQLRDIIAEWQPGLIIGELPYGSQSATSAKAHGICLGVMGALRVHHELPCQWVTPQASKKAVVGRKDASKEQVQAVVLQLWPEIARAKNAHLEHIADAMAALVAARETDLYRMVAQQRRIVDGQSGEQAA